MPREHWWQRRPSSLEKGRRADLRLQLCYAKQMKLYEFPFDYTTAYVPLLNGPTRAKRKLVSSYWEKIKLVHKRRKNHTKLSSQP
jgi:hypothetical protein